ncbi:MAG: hypothetical protein R3E64_14145 [Halioglobus sp.]
MLTGDPQESQRLLSLSEQLPLLAQHIYHTGEAETISSRRYALDALLAGAIDVPQASALLGDTEVDVLLEHLLTDIQHRMSKLAANQLSTKTTRGTFRLLDEIVNTRRALGAGANPNKQLLSDALLSKYVRCLGVD